MQLKDTTRIRSLTPTSLRAARRRLRFTQAQLADALGVAQPHISRLENGEHDISRAITLAVAYLELLDQAPEFVFFHRRGRD